MKLTFYKELTDYKQVTVHHVSVMISALEKTEEGKESREFWL